VLVVALILGLAGVPYLTTLVFSVFPLVLIRLIPPRLPEVAQLEGVDRAAVTSQLRWVMRYVIVLILLAIPGSYITSLHPLLLFPDRVGSGLFSLQHVAGSVLFGLAPGLYLARRFRSTRRQLGLAGITRWRWLGPAIVATPFTLLLAVGVFATGHGSLPPPGMILAAVLIAVFAAAIPEELLFRALLQTRLEVVYGRWMAIIVTAVLFGLMHAPQTYFLGSSGKHGVVYAVLMSLLNQGAGGLIWGYMWSRYRNLWVIFAMHAAGDTFGFVGVLGGFIPPP
jgi:membrane protease YdiL (CAAX protease family)